MNPTLLIGALLSTGAAASFLPTTTSQDCASSKTRAALVSYEDKADIVDTAIAAGSFKTLAAALKAADLVDALKGKGPFTVFAPTDAAFAALPKGTLETLLKPENKATLQTILTYHVVAGDVRAKDVVRLTNADTLSGQRVDIQVDKKTRTVTIDGATVTTTDIECRNGVIHVIDKVILPNTEDIIGTAVGAGSFNTLAAALKAGGLIEALQGKGPFTVFAPTDAAFAALPEGTVETLLKPENRDQLVAILKYHVVSGRVFSDQAAKLHEATTLQGSVVKIRAAEGKLWVGGASVVTADLDTTNGVIHVIDKVLLPE